MSTPFTEEKYNALYQALEEILEELEPILLELKNIDIRATKKDTAIFIVDKLEELGYKITKK